MFSKQELEELLKDTKAAVERLGSWQPVQVQLASGEFKNFGGVKLRSARTVGGRHADLVAIRCDSEQEEFKETSMQVEVGAGWFPVESEKDKWQALYGYNAYVRFVELIYPF
jgi:hypothetical protein